MSNWFGSLDLAYKYSLVFGGLLALTIVAGLVKVLYDRRRLKKFAQQQDAEQGQQEEQMELNRREKDEGDLFGVRAIEAGFYAGIPQSRPTSRAGSVAHTPNMSSSTLVGGFNTPKYHSMSSSISSLPAAHTNDRNRDSETLPSIVTPSQRMSPPSIKLRPSEAELSGRINHNATINMNLTVPPSPVMSEHKKTWRHSGSDSGESDANTSLRSANSKPDHYSPVPPPIPMSNNLRATVMSAESGHRSHYASVNDPSPSQSPSASAPASPRFAPEAKPPTMPERAHSNDSPVVYNAYRTSEQSNEANIERPSSPVRLLPTTYQPSHQRDVSRGSSVYSEKRTSTYKPQHDRTMSAESNISYNYSYPERSPRNSVALATSKEQAFQRNSFLAPDSTNTSQTSDPRFSEFYDAYYRQSQLNPGQKTETSKRPNQINTSEPTIEEVPSPLPSPQPPTSSSQPGAAL